MFNELLKNVMNLGIITDDDVKRLTAIELMLLIIERINGLLLHVNDVDGKLATLLEEIYKVTVEELNKWTQDGTFDTLINQTALKKVNDRLDETNAQLSEVTDLLDETSSKLSEVEISKKGYYHIKSFKCDDGVLVTGDGVHDDATGIQKAIDTLNGDGIIVLTEGVYLISEFLQLKSNTTLIGLGKVVIKAKSDFNKSVNNCMVDLSNSSNVTIENIEFLADGSNRSKSIGHIMVLSNSHYCNFVDVIFSDTGNLTDDVASNLASSSLVQL